MNYSSVIGVSAPESGWVPSPGFILRRAAILDHMAGFSAGRAIEVGCGPGGMLYEFSRMGYRCIGVELSDQSRSISRVLLSEYPDVQVLESVDLIQDNDFDYLFSFEVLEHIEDDLAALKRWVSLLKKGGMAVISVPAHKNKWNDTDVLAGHYRRYEREDVKALLTTAGLEIESITSCGWPLSWLLEKVRLWGKRKQYKNIDIGKVETGNLELTMKSGVERDMEARFFKYYGNSFIGQPILYLLTRLQKLFYRTNLGISYIVVARKPYS